jgi:tRNA(Ile)-lysidine synthase
VTAGAHDLLAADFNAAMQRLGPFSAAARLAVAVSGGADSMALALLARRWCLARGGTLHGVIVDHGLRAGSAAEAASTLERLAGQGISAEIATLSLAGGPAIQQRARAARYAALTAAARRHGCLHLLLGHHAGDQAETVAMRAARGARGLEGMAACAARNDVLLLRPLLAVAANALQAFLRDQHMGWVEDPSNSDPKFERVRIRQQAAGRAPEPAGTRQAEEQAAAGFLARHAAFYPEGFAVLAADAAPPAALAALLRVIGGANYPPARAALCGLAAQLRPATLGGVRIMPAGRLGADRLSSDRLGAGWLLAREPAAVAPPIPATADAVWDRRFRLRTTQPGALLGALGAEAANFRRNRRLPALVLQTMPCLRREAGATEFPLPASLALFCPPAPAASHPFST